MMERESISGPPSAFSGKSAATRKIRFLWKTDKNGIWSFPETNADPVVQRLVSLLSGNKLADKSDSLILDPVELLTEAFAGRETFGGHAIIWIEPPDQPVSTLRFWGTPLYSADGA
ncbi:MAG: hypothetical protein ACKPE2_23060, partial [Dolichospermum sp.]